MNLALLLSLAAAGGVATWAMTAAVRLYALRSGLMDHPNERSSHSAPTPRGGGVAIVASFMLLVMGIAGWIERALCIAMLGSGAFVATLGYLDDRSHLSAGKRFLGHLVAAAWVLFWFGSLPPVPIFGVVMDLGLATTLLSAFFLVWFINVFNFMDGIDGIASLEAISMALSGALVWWLVQPNGSWPLAVVFSACVGGFLVWNFPPARIFMGDAGSGFLGLVVALLALWSGLAAPHLFWCWFILAGCFTVDASTTLVRRVRRGDRFNEAHRNHAYQYASRRHASHKNVSLAIVALNAFWLTPVAVAVALRFLDGVIGVLLSYAPLIWLAFHYKAGDRKGQAS